MKNKSLLVFAGIVLTIVLLGKCAGQNGGGFSDADDAEIMIRMEERARR